MLEEDRKCLLVGSMPFGSEELCMQTAAQTSGKDSLIAMPDGQVGEKSMGFPFGLRQSWVHTAGWEMIRNAKAFEVTSEPKKRTKDGFMGDNFDRWHVKPKYLPNE